MSNEILEGVSTMGPNSKRGLKRHNAYVLHGWRMPNVLFPILAIAALSSSCAHMEKPSQPPQKTSAVTEESVLPPLSDSAQKRAEALARYSEGLVLEQRRDIPGALSNYMMAAQLDPENEPLQMRIAVLLLQQKRTPEAVAVLEKLAAKPGASERPLLMLAMVYEGSDDLDNAEHVYRKLLSLYPDRQEAYANLARLYLKKEQLDAAISILEEAARKLQDSDELAVLLAAAHIMRAEKQPNTVQDYLDAIRALDRLSARHPEDWRIKLRIAELYLRAGEYKKALDALEPVEKATSDATEVKMRLAELLVKGREPSAVLEELAKVAASEAHPERVYYYMGLVSEAANLSDQAAEYYRRAAEGTQPQINAFVSLAVLQSTNLSHSVETIQRGLEKFPEHPMLLNVIANIYFLQTNFATAAQFFERALTQSESTGSRILNANFFFSYCVALLNLGNIQGAAEQLQQATRLNPLVLESFLQLAFRQNDPEIQKKYVETLERVGDLLSGEPDVYLYLGVLNSYLGFHQEALRAFERVERMVREAGNPDQRLNAQFYFWYGSAAERSGEFERAEKLFLKCIELDPNHAEALNYLAYMWAERGLQLDRALELVRRALELQPTSGAFVDTLGWIYYMQGNYTQALVEINRAAELIPEDPTILEHLGDVFEKLGDEEQAMPHWKRSFVLNPQNEKLAEKLIQRGVDLEPLRKQVEELKRQKATSATPPATDTVNQETTPTLLSPLPAPPEVLSVDDYEDSMEEPFE